MLTAGARWTHRFSLRYHARRVNTERLPFGNLFLPSAASSSSSSAPSSSSSSSSSSSLSAAGADKEEEEGNGKVVKQKLAALQKFCRQPKSAKTKAWYCTTILQLDSDKRDDTKSKRKSKILPRGQNRVEVAEPLLKKKGQKQEQQPVVSLPEVKWQPEGGRYIYELYDVEKHGEIDASRLMDAAKL